MLSNEFDWNVSRHERAQDFLEVYDVRRAKIFIVSTPRPVERRSLDDQYREFFTDYLLGVRFKANVDWSQVDVNFPVIFGTDENGKLFPIDGRHRMQKALNEATSEILYVRLTPEETEAIHSGTAI